MNRLMNLSLVVALVLLTAAYALAEKITLVTNLPFARGAFQAFFVRGNTPSISVATAGTAATDQAILNLFTAGGPDGTPPWEAGEKAWVFAARGNLFGTTPLEIQERNNLTLWRWNSGWSDTQGDVLPVLTLDFGTGAVGLDVNVPGASLQVATVNSVPNSCGGQDWLDTATHVKPSAVRFNDNPAGGCGDDAYIAYYGVSGIPDKTVLEIANHNDPEDDIALMPSGFVGIGTSTPTAMLDVQGNALINGKLIAQNNLGIGGNLLQQVADPAQNMVFSGKLTVDRIDASTWGQASDIYIKATGLWMSQLNGAPVPNFTNVWFYHEDRNDGQRPIAPPAGYDPIANCIYFVGEWRVNQPEDWSTDCTVNAIRKFIGTGGGNAIVGGRMNGWHVRIRYESSGCSAGGGVAPGKATVHTVCWK